MKLFNKIKTFFTKLHDIVMFDSKSGIDPLERVICLCLIPYVIVKHVCTIIGYILSILALICSGLIAVVCGRYYSQYCEYTIYDEKEYIDRGLPHFFWLISGYTHNQLTKIYIYIIEKVQYKGDGNDDEPTGQN